MNQSRYWKGLLTEQDYVRGPSERLKLNRRTFDVSPTLYARCRVAEVEGREACSMQRREAYRRTKEVGTCESFSGMRLRGIRISGLPGIQGAQSPECVNLRAFVMRRLAG